MPRSAAECCGLACPPHSRRSITQRAPDVGVGKEAPLAKRRPVCLAFAPLGMPVRRALQPTKSPRQLSLLVRRAPDELAEPRWPWKLDVDEPCVFWLEQTVEVTCWSCIG